MKHRKTSVLQQVKARWQLLVMLAVPLGFVLLFSYVPMFGIQIAFRSFEKNGGITGSPWVGLYQFARFTQSYMFGRIIKNTFILSFYSLVAGFPVPVIFALVLNAMPFQRYKKAIQTLTYVPHFISTVVFVGILMQLFSVRNGIYGIVGKFLTGHVPEDIYGTASSFRHIYVWSGVWQGLGWNSIIYIAALTGIDPGIHEAAIIDGASRWQRMKYIDIPGILPTVSIMLILAMGGILSVGFEKAYLMQTDLNLQTSEVISTYVYKIGLVTGGGDFSFGTAVGLFNSLVSFTMVITVNTISKKLGGSSLW